MISKFGVSAHRESWGVVGFSMGGTCAVDLAVMHPDIFSAFEDIAGDIAPNSGTKDETISRLFGGNAAAYASFDPTNVITRHGAYNDVAGWFAVNSEATPEQTFGRELAVRAGQRQRDHLRRRRCTRYARLDLRIPGLRYRAALDGRSTPNPRGSADAVADTPHHRQPHRRSSRWPRSSG